MDSRLECADHLTYRQNMRYRRYMSTTAATTSRERQKAATREALLAAGRTVFVRDGYQRASLDRVAAEAGFTKGAVYANFATKADLLLAIYEERSAARVELIPGAAAASSDLEDLRRRLVDDWRHVVERERGWSLLLIEFWVHAAREPKTALFLPYKNTHRQTPHGD